MMRPPREYREAEEKRSDARPVLIFIIAAILIVLGLEMIKSGRLDIELPGFMRGEFPTRFAFVDTEELRQVHENYMEEGIDVTEYYNPSSDRKDIPAYRQETAQDIIVAVKKDQEKTRQETRNLEDILSDISPAAGVEGETTAFQQRKNAFRKETHEKQENLLEGVEFIKHKEPKVAEVIEVKAEEVVEPKVQPKPPVIAESGLKKIVIIIDDMGVNAKNSRIVEEMQGPLTLSYLPYAKGLPEFTAKAKANGHELMVHMPMEPMDGKLNGGPAVLKTGQDPEKFEEILTWGLSQFDGYVGLNNHMGSRLTQDRTSMEMIMEEIKKRGIYFVDSVTIASSIGAQVAEREGVPHAQRDIFLDHEITKDFVRDALRKLEVVAKYKGHAIAIGHPHDETIAVLKEWLPTLQERGFELVPASAVIYRQNQENIVAEN